MFFSIDSGRSRISGTASQGGPPLTSYNLVVVVHRLLATPPGGGHYELDVFSVKFFLSPCPGKDLER
jgi:hypothetical protein